MRHSVVTLTLDTYGHLLPGQEADAVDGLGQFFESPEMASQQLRKTGTDAVAIRASDGGGAVNAQYQLHNPRKQRAPTAQIGPVTIIDGEPRKSLSADELCNGVQPNACDLQIRPAGFEPATCGLEVRCSIQLSYGAQRNGLQSIQFSPSQPANARACRLTHCLTSRKKPVQ